MRLFTFLPPFLLVGLFTAATAAHEHNVTLPKNPRINQTPSFTLDELYNLTTAFVEAFMYPNNLAQTASINSTIFSEDVLGRVDVTRTFPGREASPLNSLSIPNVLTPSS